MPLGAVVFVSRQAVGRCGDGPVGVPAGVQTVEVRASGRLPLRIEMRFVPFERYDLLGELVGAVPGLDSDEAVLPIE